MLGHVCAALPRDSRSSLACGGRKQPLVGNVVSWFVRFIPTFCLGSRYSKPKKSFCMEIQDIYVSKLCARMLPELWILIHWIRIRIRIWIQHLKWFRIQGMFVDHFCAPRSGSGLGIRIRIRIQGPHWIPNLDTDPDPQHWMQQSLDDIPTFLVVSPWWEALLVLSAAWLSSLSLGPQSQTLPLRGTRSCGGSSLSSAHNQNTCLLFVFSELS